MHEIKNQYVVLCLQQLEYLGQVPRSGCRYGPSHIQRPTYSIVIPIPTTLFLGMGNIPHGEHTWKEVYNSFTDCDLTTLLVDQLGTLKRAAGKTVG